MGYPIDLDNVKIDRGCRFCGRQFFAVRLNQQYCSTDCRMTAWRKKERVERPKDVRTCKGCETEIVTSDARKVFCSKECRFRYFNDKRPTLKELKRVCKFCGEKFLPRNTKGKGQVYCSDKCRNSFLSNKHKERTAAHRRAWQKKNKWGGNWENAVVRDKYTCQMCGAYYPPSKWTTGVHRLEVHHLDGSGETSSKNHQLDNLMTLCKPCHSEYHVKIGLVRIDGKFYIRGSIFDKLGISTVPTIGANQ